MNHLRVLVTGAGGFVGRAVVDQLGTDGHEVTAFVHRDDSLAAVPSTASASAAVDLTDGDQVAAAIPASGFDAVCHLAAVTRVRESFDNPLHVFDVNVVGSLNLLRALQERNRATGGWTRFVLASTVAVYGSVDTGVPLREDRVPAPTNPYGASKLAVEQLVAAQAATGAIGAVTLRCFNVAGAINGRGDPDLTRVIPKAVAVAAGEAPYFGLNGDGSAVREFVHVADVADAFSRAVSVASRGATLTINVGSGKGVSMRALLGLVEQVTGRPVPVRHNPPKPEPGFLVADIGLAKEHLGWSPRRSDLASIVHDAWEATVEHERAGRER
jgi:UDP-glucose 4-epimerase